MTNLDLALLNTWDYIAHFLFEDLGRDSATAAEVRQFMKEYLDFEPVTNRNVRRFWKPLTEVEKSAALESAFPGGTNYDRNSRPDVATRSSKLPECLATQRGAHGIVDQPDSERLARSST